MGYGSFRSGIVDGTAPTPGKLPAAINGGNVCLFAEVFDLSLAAVEKVVGTKNFVARKPKGHALISIEVISTVSLTTSQLSFGIIGATTKYGAAKAYGTTAKARVLWDEPSLLDTIPEVDEDIWMYGLTTDLPGAGKIAVQMLTAARG